MTGFKQQHYVPAFLLKHWHSPTDHKLTQFRWANEQVRTNRHSAKHVAKARHLYSTLRSADQPDTALERDYMTPHVDTPASVVHAAMLQDGVGSMTPEQAQIWARFLVAQMLRVPDKVEQIRIRGREILMAGLDEEPEEYDAIRGNAPEETLAEWLQAHGPDVLDDLGINTMPSIIESQLLNGALLKARWALLDLNSSNFDLVIGDKPLVLAGALSGGFLAALPVAPRKLFVAYDNPGTLENILKQRQTDFVKITNKDMVSRASKYVYGTSAESLPLIRKWLQKP